VKYFIVLMFMLFSSLCFSAELTYEDAVTLADRTDKTVFLYFGAEWCGYCNKMKQVFGEEEVAKELDKRIIMFIDVDKNSSLKRKFSVRTIPDYMIIDGKENVIKRNKGYMNKDSFINWLKESK